MRKSNLSSLILLTMIINIGSAFGQRFTGTEQPAKTSSKPDTGFINAEKAYLAIKAGKLDDARKFLSVADASNPFAMYVRADLTQDATEAANIYKLIVNEYSDKPIAREALLQLYKYHYAAGNYRLAHTDYLELNKYPGMTQLVDPDGLSDSLQGPTLPISPIPQSSPAPSVSIPETSQNYSVQLGVFSTQANADRFVTQLKADKIDARVSTKASTGRTLYIVAAGKFSTRKAADAFAADLKSRAIECMVVEAGEAQQ